ncbi:hypothetical protein LCGC14_2285870, partial [marine sediment metagenome]
MILCNGLPKSGTHYLSACLEMMGSARFDVVALGPGHFFDHFKVGADLPEHDKHILIIRHPRNILMSFARSRYSPLLPGQIISAMYGYSQFVGSPERLDDCMGRFAGWLDDKSVYPVRYEDMTTDGGAAVEKLAAHIGGTSEGVY